MKMNATYYEEYFLLYIDNELSDEQKVAVENFMEENPAYKKEFYLIQQSVLAPEIILFEDKVLLYRLEELEASLPISIKQGLYREEAKLMKGYFNTKFIRNLISIAAAILLIITYKWVPTFLVKQNNNTELATNLNATKIASNPYLKNSINSNDRYNKQAASRITPTANEGIDLLYKENTDTASNASSSSTLMNNNYYKQPGIIQSLVTSSPVLSIKEKEAMTAPNLNNTAAIMATTEKINNAEANVILDTQEDFENINTDNPDRTIYIANMEIDGDKLRGLTRRIGAFMKRNKTEKEK